MGKNILPCLTLVVTEMTTENERYMRQRHISLLIGNADGRYAFLDVKEANAPIRL